jgi:hypothetical protein
MNSRDMWELYRALASSHDDPTASATHLAELATIARELRADAERSKGWKGELDDCIHEIATHANTFARAILAWMVSDEDAPTAKLLARKASVVHFQATAPAKYDLSAADRDAGLLAAMRLCSIFVAPAVSLGWAMSLVASEPAGDGMPSTAGLVAVLQYHAEEFQNTTRKLLESEGSPFGTLEASRQLVEGLKQAGAALDGLPPLREFAMSPEMRMVLSGVRRMQNRQTGREARRRSILGQLATTQHFKYSNRTAIETRVGNEVKETTLAMSSFGFGYELPLSELTDPVRGRFRRAAFWNGEFE